MGYTPRKDTQFSGTEQLTNLTALSGGTIDLSAATTARVPTVAGSSDSSTKAASTAFVQAVAGTLATTAYVDNAVAGLDAKASVRLATTAAITLASRTSTTLTTGASTLTIDGSAVVNGDRVLVKDTPTGGSSTAADCGIYTVSGVGSTVVLTRATDADTWAELIGAYVWVEIGTANADSGWLCTNDAGGTLGTTAVTFVQFNGLGQITAGNGLTKTGNTIDVGAGTGILSNTNDVAIDTTVVPQLAVSNAFTGATLSLTNANAEIKAVSGSSIAKITADGNTSAYFQGKLGGALKGVLEFNSGLVQLFNVSSDNLISGSQVNSNVTLGNSTGTLTSAATAPAYTDSSTKVVTTALLQTRHKTKAVTTVANASFPYTALTSDEVVLLQQTATGKTVTLPAASAMAAGQTLTFKDASASGAQTFSVAINRAGSDTIDGLTSYTMDQTAEAVTLMSDGTSKWYII